MVDPIQGSGSSHNIQHNNLNKNPPPLDDDKKKEVKLDPQKNSIAIYFVQKWGWSPEKALQAEKAFIKTIMEECQKTLNKYKNIFKKLNPEAEENQ